MFTKLNQKNSFKANKSINKFNVATIQQSGKVGTVRYYQRGGETYVRSAHNTAITAH